MRTGKPVTVSTVIKTEQASPGFTAQSGEQAFARVHALPLRSGKAVLGALALLGTRSANLTSDDVHIAQALADVATANVVQQRALDQAKTRAAQLQEALNSRVLIEQAKGALAQRGGIRPDQAFRALRHHARSYQQSLRQLAAHVIGNDDLADKILNGDAVS